MDYLQLRINGDMELKNQFLKGHAEIKYCYSDSGLQDGTKEIDFTV